MTFKSHPLPKLAKTYKKPYKKPVPHNQPTELGELRTKRISSLTTPAFFQQMKNYAYRIGFSYGKLIEVAVADYMNRNPLSEEYQEGSEK